MRSPRRASVQHELIRLEGTRAGAGFPDLSCRPEAGSLWQQLPADSLGRQAAQIPSCCHMVLLNRISPCLYFA